MFVPQSATLGSTKFARTANNSGSSIYAIPTSPLQGLRCISPTVHGHTSESRLASVPTNLQPVCCKPREGGAQLHVIAPKVDSTAKSSSIHQRPNSKECLRVYVSHTSVSIKFGCMPTAISLSLALNAEYFSRTLSFLVRRGQTHRGRYRSAARPMRTVQSTRSLRW